MKIRPVGAEVFHTDGRTDMTKLIVPFHNFSNAPKKLDIKVTVIHVYAYPTELPFELRSNCNY